MLIILKQKLTRQSTKYLKKIIWNNRYSLIEKVDKVLEENNGIPPKSMFYQIMGVPCETKKTYIHTLTHTCMPPTAYISNWR